MLFRAVLWTVITSDELPPEHLEQLRAERTKRGLGHALSEIFGGLKRMPKTMAQLAFVQFFSWIGLFAMWIYTTSAVAENVFGTVDARSAVYQDAGNWVSTLFAVYSGVSALAAFILPVLARATSRRVVHMICLVIGGVSLASVSLVHDKYLLMVPMIGIGIAWASILTMPYAILAGALPAHRMGYYMGVFNFFVTLPQIVSGLLLGFVTSHFFAGHTAGTIAVGGASMALGGVLTLWVRDTAKRVE